MVSLKRRASSKIRLQKFKNYIVALTKSSFDHRLVGPICLKFLKPRVGLTYQGITLRNTIRPMVLPLGIILKNCMVKNKTTNKPILKM